MYTKAVRDCMLWKYGVACRIAASKYNRRSLCSNLVSFRMHASGLPT